MSEASAKSSAPLIASQLLLSRKDISQLRVHDDYAIHRVVYSLFEDVRAPSPGQERDPSASAGLLYADGGLVDDQRRILMLSNRPPASRVSDRYGRVDSREVSAGFLSHDRYRFQVVANPVISRAKGGRDPIRNPSDIAQWFASRASAWGFLVDVDQVDATSPMVRRIKTPSGHTATISQSRISGILTVQDRCRFSSSFRSGIGRARAFGCGLLQVKPILAPSISEGNQPS